MTKDARCPCVFRKNNRLLSLRRPQQPKNAQRDVLRCLGRRIGCGQHLGMIVVGSSGVIGHQGKPQDLHTERTRHDGLADGGHPHVIRFDIGERPDLRRRFVGGSQQARIRSFCNIDPGIMGGILTFAVMASIWVNDSFAYIFGSRFGRTKLAPKISPNKSWEGFFGGMLGSVLVWVLISLLGLMAVPIPMAILTGIVLGVFGVIGDLFESRIKRSVGVKDSGNIMPGHGGLLDRHDSMLFGVMAAAFVLKVGGLL